MVYFPEYELLYGSSMLVPSRFASVQATHHMSVLRRLVERENLTVETVFSMFWPPTPWATIGEE